MNLSKSQYLKGLQCHKYLWLDKHRKDLLPEKADSVVMETGTSIGELARGLFSGGVLVDFDRGFTAMLAQTKALLKTEQVIYEAAFNANGSFALVDILVKNGNVWDVYEVKSSTKIKGTYLNDLSAQQLAIDVPIGKKYIMHIDSNYTRQGALELDKLFHIEAVTDRLRSAEKVSQQMTEMQAILAGDEPNIGIGKHCFSPYKCSFKGHCWQDIPSPSVFNLYQMRSKAKFANYEQGRITFDDFNREKLNKIQQLQVGGELHIDKDIIADFVDSVDYPINFFDFETFQNAAPRFDNQSPYQQMPFQYSLHILQANGEIQHKEFLADEHSDPRPKLIKQMLNDIDANGSIIAFKQSFEKGVISSLARFDENNAGELLTLNKRFVDLLVPFQRGGYYHPDFKGSFSIKSVLPAMFANDDELDYKKLEIQNGGMAMNIFANLHLIDDEKERLKIRDNLLKYCHLDTLAMVRIFQKLANLSSSKPA
ncbi:hypothetical protein SPONN_1247 [uncultured Candidatus Thioglobus sp.]|nr:hypothetical protein SPONN_1247 [uncultured Candidatus Thioglobus sp.]